MATKKRREKLIDIIKRELKVRGYKEVEPDDGGGGQWSPPGDQWSDAIMPTIQDCFEKEDQQRTRKGK